MNDVIVSHAAPHSLAYAGIESPEAECWQKVGPGVFGLEARADSPGGSVLLRNDQRHHRLAAVRGERNGLAYLGWEVADEAALEAIAKRVESAGLTIVPDDPTLRDRRHFARVATFADPFGVQHELATGVRDESPFTPGRPMEGGFLTGDGGLGHVVLMVPNIELATEFYTNVMGLKHSDTIVARGMEVRFYHTNPRHHSIAFVEIPGMRGLHHFMFEVSQIDDVGRAFDLLSEFDVPVTMSLGRHPNDRMFSFYCRVPGGFEIEYGAGALRIRNDLSWDVKQFDRLSEWGHKPNGDLGPPLTLEPVAGFERGPVPAPERAPAAAAKPTAPAVAASVRGHWSTLTQTPMGDQRGALDITQDGGVLTGTMTGREGETPIYDGAIDGSTLTWKIDVTQPFKMTIEFTATLEGVALIGQAKAGNFGSSVFSATKVSVATV